MALDNSFARNRLPTGATFIVGLEAARAGCIQNEQAIARAAIAGADANARVEQAREDGQAREPTALEALGEPAERGRHEKIPVATRVNSRHEPLRLFCRNPEYNHGERERARRSGNAAHR